MMYRKYKVHKNRDCPSRPPRSEKVICVCKDFCKYKEEYYVFGQFDGSDSTTYSLYKYLPTSSSFSLLQKFEEQVEYVNFSMVYRAIDGSKEILLFLVTKNRGLVIKEYNLRTKVTVNITKKFRAVPGCSEIKCLYKKSTDTVYCVVSGSGYTNLKLCNVRHRVFTNIGKIPNVGRLKDFTSCWTSSKQDGLIVYGGLIEHTLGYNDYYERPNVKKEFSEKVFLYNLKTKRLKKIKTFGVGRNSPVGRYKHKACCLNGKMYVFGGSVNIYDEKLLNDLFVLDLETYTWNRARLTNDKIKKTCKHIMGIYCNPITEKVGIFIFGGNRVQYDDETDITKSLYEIELPETFHSREKQERVDFLLEESNKLCDYKLEFRNKTISTFRVLFSESRVIKKIESDSVQLNHSTELESEDLHNILFGEDNSRTKQLVDLYLLFCELEMNKHSHVVLYRVHQIVDFAKLYTLLRYGMTKMKIDNIFIRNILTILQNKKKTVQRISWLLRNLKSIFPKIFNEKICKSYQLDLKRLSEFKSFQNIFDNLLRTTFITHNYSNLQIQSCEGKVFKVHREILIFRSNFFYKMYKFRGQEVTQDIIKIEYLNTKCLQSYLFWLYFCQITPPEKSNDQTLHELFNILTHAEMYFENELKGKCLHKINSVYEKFYQYEVFNERFEQSKLIFNSLPESVQQELLQSWKYIFIEIRKKKLKEYCDNVQT